MSIDVLEQKEKPAEDITQENIDVSIKAKTPHKLSRWQKLATSKIPSHRFLIFVAPVLEFLYQQLNAKVNELDHVKKLITPARIASQIRDDAKVIILPMVIKCCVLNLHYAREAGELKGETKFERFDDYIEKLQDPVFVDSFLSQYPVLHHLIDAKLTNYLYSMLSFFEHLDSDLTQIKEEIFTDFEVNKIHKLVASGDTHRKGKRVFVVTFSDKNNAKRKMIYKPHSLGMDVAYHNFLDWYNSKKQNSNSQILQGFKVIDKEDHGWSEFVTHEGCNTAKQLDDFYHSLGEILCLMYMLGGLDLHHENLIANGPNPIVVDLECLLTPDMGSLSHSVKRHVGESLLMPNKTNVTRDFAGVDISGIGGEGKQRARYKRTTWAEAGTDNMRISREEFELPPSQNNPFLKGKKAKGVGDYYDHVYNGFSEAYHNILANKDELLQEDSVFSNFDGIGVRLLLRNTADYASLMNESYHPTLFANEKKYHKHISDLEKDVKYKPETEALLESELQDMYQGDIPFFETLTNSDKVYNSFGNPVDYPVKKPGFDYHKSRFVDEFSEADLKQQQLMIKTCFHAKKFNDAFEKGDMKQLSNIKANRESKSSYEFGYDSGNLTNSVNNIKAQAESLIRVCLNYLSHIKVTSGENITWPSMVYQEHQAMTAGFAGTSLYDGNFGILLAFSYAHKLLGENDYQNIANTCLDSFIADLKKQEDMFFSAGWSGLGGILFALCKYYNLGDKLKIQDLTNILLDKSNKSIEHDDAYDILGGVCGLIPALIKVNKTFGFNVNDLINTSVAHILKRCRTPGRFYPKPEKSEITIQIKPKAQLGFGHGLAGAAWSMLLALPYLQDDLMAKAKTWISEAIDYLDKKYNKKGGFWPDLRSHVNADGNEQKGPHWCAGHVGIGHFYLELFKQNWPDKRIEDRLISVIGMAKKYLKQDQPLLNHCCGVYGDLDLLMCIKEQLPDWSSSHISDEELINIQASLVAQIEHRGAPRYESGEHSSFISGLFQGHAGTAYILMRIIHPKVVGSVLGWEV